MVNDVVKKIDNYIEFAKKNNIHQNMNIFIDALYYINNDVASLVSRLNSKSKYQDKNRVLSKSISLIIIIFQKYINEEYKINSKYEITNNFLGYAKAAYDPDKKSIIYPLYGLMLENESNVVLNMITIAHENRHVMQYNAYSLNNLDEILKNETNYLYMLKEILYMHSRDSADLYLKNYNKISYEEDAERFALKFVYNFLKKYMPDLLNEINLRIDYEIEDGIVNTSFENEMSLNGSINSYYQSLDGNIDKLISIDEYIKNHPKLQKRYPLLKLSFNGISPITYDELNNKMNKYYDYYTKNNKYFYIASSPHYESHITNYVDQLISLYHVIIKTDPLLYLEYIIDNNYDRDYIMHFINKHISIYDNYKDEVNDIFNKYNFENNIKVRKK